MRGQPAKLCGAYILETVEPAELDNLLEIAKRDRL